MPLPTDTRRPRGGQTWADKAGREVKVHSRRTVRPMAGVRPHSDMRWSMVAWLTPNGSGGGVMHESDFVKEFRFVEGIR